MSQPEFQVDADDLDVGATATVYTGDPIVHREDTDGDGQVDRLSVDFDADGDADLVEHDTDGDGRFDQVSYVSTVTSSTVSGFTDNDGDGHYERVLRDTDGDGVSDGVEEDLDGDGVADRFGLGLGPDDPFGEPELWVDKLPEPRDGITEPLVDAPLGPDALDLPLADPAFGSGASDATSEREMDYEREAVNEFADTLQEVPSPGRLDATVAGSPYEAPSDVDDVDDAYAAPVFAPVAETSDLNDALAAPDDGDAYVG